MHPLWPQYRMRYHEHQYIHQQMFCKAKVRSRPRDRRSELVMLLVEACIQQRVMESAVGPVVVDLADSGGVYYLPGYGEEGRERGGEGDA